MGKYDSKMEPEEHIKDWEKLSEKEQNSAIMNPGHVDEGIWEKAKKAVHKEYGEFRWPVVMHVYEKMGGK